MFIMIHYACDFEATVPLPEHHGLPSEQLKQLPTEVYLAAALDVDNPDEPAHVHYSIEEFMGWVFDQPSCTFWFHNLKNYDGWFVIAWLLHQGFVHVPTGEHNCDHSRFIVGTRGDFTVFDATQKRAWNFYDSRRMVTGSIKSLGQMVGHVQKGDETPLVPIGSTLTDTPRASGGHWTWDDAVSYIDSDVRVLAHALASLDVPVNMENGYASQSSLADATMRFGHPPKVERIKEFRARNMPKYPSINDKTVRLAWGLNPQPVKGEPSIYDAMGLPTTPGGAPADKYSYLGMIDGKPVFGTGQPEDYVVKHWVTKNMVGARPSNHLLDPPDKGIRAKLKKRATAGNETALLAYKGGFNWVNPRFAGEWVGHGEKLDINSMYPWIYSSKPLPGVVPVLVGKGHYTNLCDEYPTEFGIVTLSDVDATCHEGSTPVLKPRTDAVATMYETYYDNPGLANGTEVSPHNIPVNEVYSPHLKVSTITLTTVELDYLKQHYDIHNATVTWSCWYGRDKRLEQLMKNHCDKWMAMKEKGKQTGDQSLVTYAKMMLNSVYGKLGEYVKTYDNPEYIVTPDGSIIDEARRKTPSGKTTPDLPAASFITAYGRIHLANTINEIGLDRFLYCDTDSVMFLGTLGDKPDSIELHPSKLGAWDHEGSFTEGKFIKCKTYGLELVDGGWHTTAAGFSQQIPREQFNTGVKFPDLRPVRTHTGTILMDTLLTIGKPRGVPGVAPGFTHLSTSH